MAVLTTQDSRPLAIGAVKWIVRRGLNQIPRAFCDFGFQLAGAPPGVPGVDTNPAGTARRYGRQVDESHAGQGSRIAVTARAQCDCHLRFDRPAVEDPLRLSLPCNPFREMINDEFRSGAIEDEPDRPLLVMLKHEDDGSPEVGVDQQRSCDQELSCVSLDHRVIVPYESGFRVGDLPQFASADSLSGSGS